MVAARDQDIDSTSNSKSPHQLYKAVRCILVVTIIADLVWIQFMSSRTEEGSWHIPLFHHGMPFVYYARFVHSLLQPSPLGGRLLAIFTLLHLYLIGH